MKASPKARLRRHNREARKEEALLFLPPEILQGVGEVAIKAAYLDVGIERFVEAVILPCPDQLSEIIDKLSIPKKIDLIKSYLELAFPPEWHTEIREFVSNVHSARRERDDVVHRLWAATEDPFKKDLIKTGRALHFKVARTVDAGWLRDLGERLENLRLDLLDWSDERITSVHQRRTEIRERLEKHSGPT